MCLFTATVHSMLSLPEKFITYIGTYGKECHSLVEHSIVRNFIGHFVKVIRSSLSKKSSSI